MAGRLFSGSVERGRRGLVIRVTTLVTKRDRQAMRPPTLVVSAGYIWNSPGAVRSEGDLLIAESPGTAPLAIYCDGPSVRDRNIPLTGLYQTFELGDEGVTIYVRKPRDRASVEALLEARAATVDSSLDETDGDAREVAAAVQSSLAWNTIFDPEFRRVVTPVSRVWSSNQAGWVLFCWDTYFAALLAAQFGNRDLAYANLVEITRHAVPAGFVPNVANAYGFVSLDRSQPPVGAPILLEIFKRFGDRFILNMLFEPLLKWNRWWHAARRAGEGCLAWGSNAYEPVVGNEWETPAKVVGGRFGASLESGMDNSPSYDEVDYDPQTGTLELQDVGLTSMYVADCRWRPARCQ